MGYPNTNLIPCQKSLFRFSSDWSHILFDGYDLSFTNLFKQML